MRKDTTNVGARLCASTDTDTSNLPELPTGWVWTRLGEMIDKIPLTGRKLKQSEYQEEGKFPVIDQGQAFIGGHTDREELKVCCERPLIIFGDHTKIVKYVDFDFVAGADGVKVIKPLEAFYPKLFYYFIQMVPLPDKGYARHFQFVEKSAIPLPPLAEQQRIVAKIEELFTELDAGVEALQKVKAQLKRYRQAVLKHAFEGKLTEAWREMHRGELEPASVLLERMRDKRAKNINVGAHSRAPRARAPRPYTMDASSLPQLPEGWVWTTLGNIASFKNGINFDKTQKGNNGILTIDVLNMYSHDIRVNLKGLYRVNRKPEKDYLLENGDILFVRSSVKREGVGWAALFKEIEEPVTFCGFIIRSRLHSEDLLPEYITYFLRTNFARELIVNSGSQVTITNISQPSLGRIPIPIPPLAEQHKIVEEIERRFSIADEVEKVVEQSLKQAERLRQSILKKAFGGKLVPQDANDDPADKLLERIKQARMNPVGAAVGAHSRAPKSRAPKTTRMKR
jgi:type I restriction enzyme S subunit